MVSLVVPASSDRMLEKARELDVSELVLDLEDAVTPANKASARAAAVAWITAGLHRARKISVRVNAPGTPWAHEDLIALGSAESRPHTLVVPKVESAGDLAFVDRLLDGIERAAGHAEPLGVQALIETAAGLRALDEIVAASPRLSSLILGYADMGVSLGRSRAGSLDLDRWLAIQDDVLSAARATRLSAIDGPFLAIDDPDRLAASAMRAADLGFDGKWAIHPSQMPVIVAAFTPSEEEVARAESVLAAMSAGERGGHGAVTLDGEMVDEPVRLAALRTLELAGRSWSETL
jgi:citrate lyase subunit beta/citryl-CoA lyase